MKVGYMNTLPIAHGNFSLASYFKTEEKKENDMYLSHRTSKYHPMLMWYCPVSNVS